MLTIFDSALFNKLHHEAASSTRLRQNHNVHESLDDSVQRLLNAMEPGSYVRPHRHLATDKWELFLAVSGKLCVLTFSESGVVLERAELSPGGPQSGVEIRSDEWHTLVALEPGSIVFEAKLGPYRRTSAKDFASWAPDEGEAEAMELELWFRNAQPGDIATILGDIATTPGSSREF